MHIHLGHSEKESLFAADALLQSAGIKVDAIADLGNAEFDLTDAGSEGLGLEPIGVSEAFLGALVRLCLKDGRALLAHGFVEKEAETFGEAGGAVSGEKLQNGVEKVRVVRVGHVWIFGWMCLATPQHGTTLALPPPPCVALPRATKCGNSKTTHRIDLMKRFLRIIPASDVKALTMDREFIGKEWLQ